MAKNSVLETTMVNCAKSHFHLFSRTAPFSVRKIVGKWIGGVCGGGMGMVEGVGVVGGWVCGRWRWLVCVL